MNKLLPEKVPAHCGLPVLLESRPLACVSRYEFHKPGPSCSNRAAVGALRRYLPSAKRSKSGNVRPCTTSAPSAIGSMGRRSAQVLRGLRIAQFQDTLPCQKSHGRRSLWKRDRPEQAPPVEDHDSGRELLGPVIGGDKLALPQFWCRSEA